MARRYELQRRAVRQEETRQRIIESAIDLHRTIGPAATTVSEIAARAGVGRVTVYRHFPDELTLARACSGLYFERNPTPDLARWRQTSDPTKRLRAGLADAYAYHRANEAMLTHVLADAREHPVMAPYHAYWAEAADTLAAGWPVRGRRRTLLRAGIGLALRFETWRTLVREERLSDARAIELMFRLVCEP